MKKLNRKALLIRFNFFYDCCRNQNRVANVIKKVVDAVNLFVLQRFMSKMRLTGFHPYFYKIYMQEVNKKPYLCVPNF